MTQPHFDFNTSTLTDLEVAHLASVSFYKLYYLRSWLRIVRDEQERWLSNSSVCSTCQGIAAKLGIKPEGEN